MHVNSVQTGFQGFEKVLTDCVLWSGHHPVEESSTSIRYWDYWAVFSDPLTKFVRKALVVFLFIIPTFGHLLNNSTSSTIVDANPTKSSPGKIFQ